MNKNRIVGSGKQIKGTIKEAVGKVVGNTKLQVEGKADKVEGKIQNTAGSIEDALK
ncbi:MAG TPA: CsbD family protein [Rhizomicrobium sp.]